ncbi:MAG: agmatine deiminase family protein [Clostridia bacterium]|nr:agmatine deiminase family protein [Deltaproteobacteria bacterium]
MSTQNPSPASAGFRFPAEWEPHRAVWLAWPAAADLWKENLEPARAEIKALVTAIADIGPDGKARGESIELLVATDEARRSAEDALNGLPVRFHSIPYGDIWLRDTAPLFFTSDACVRFAFNGWGEKYVLAHDAELSTRVSEAAKARTFIDGLILEGGSVEVDGLGTCLTTRQCLLNANRNPRLTETEIEDRLKASLGVRTVLWLGDGLRNDHTDGHIDTIARFVSRNTVLCMEPAGANDPNHDAMRAIYRDLSGMKDAENEPLKVGLIPSPGMVLDNDGEIMPASYLNFYIANTTVIVPTYCVAADEVVVEALKPYFPHRRVIGLSAKAILSGGGAFHCISQQQPASRVP